MGEEEKGDLRAASSRDAGTWVRRRRREGPVGKTEDVGSVQGNRGPGGGVLDGTTQPSWREDGAVRDGKKQRGEGSIRGCKQQNVVTNCHSGD